MRESGMAVLSATVVLGVLLAHPSVLAAQHAGTAATHPPTCVAGLLEYADTAMPSTPYDTLHPSVPTTRVAPDEFLSFMRGVMAKAGATGYIAQHRVVDAAHEGWRFIPLFVPADTAEVYAVCRGKHSGA